MSKDFRKNSLEFWHWFGQNEPKIRSLLAAERSPAICHAISAEIAKLGESLRWEVGPGQDQPFFFAISPNQIKDNMPLCKLAADIAPSIPDWEFLYAKPKKNWKRRVEIQISGAKIMVSFDDWKYRLVGFDNLSFFDVTFFPKNIDGATLQDYQKLGAFFAESELGEEVYMEMIDRVEILPETDHEENVTGCEYFFAHLCSLSSNEKLAELARNHLKRE